MRPVQLIASIILLLGPAICWHQANAQPAESASAVLKRSAEVIYGTDTLYYERDFPTVEMKGKTLPCKERYHLQNNSDGTLNAHYQLTIFTGAAAISNVTTTLIKNAEGLWDVYPTLAIDLSNFVKAPPSLDPFQFFRSLPTNRYELILTETNEASRKLFVVTGKSLQPDQDRKISITNGPIPIEVRYLIDKATLLPYETHEVLQNGMKLDRRYDTIDLHRKIDPGLFALGDRRKAIPSSFTQVGELKLEGMRHQYGQLKTPINLAAEAKNLTRKKTLIRVTLVVVGVGILLLPLALILKKQQVA